MAHVDERLGTHAIDRAAAILTAPGTQSGDDSAGINIAGDARFSLKSALRTYRYRGVSQFKAGFSTAWVLA